MDLPPVRMHEIYSSPTFDLCGSSAVRFSGFVIIFDSVWQAAVSSIQCLHYSGIPIFAAWCRVMLQPTLACAQYPLAITCKWSSHRHHSNSIMALSPLVAGWTARNGLQCKSKSLPAAAVQLAASHTMRLCAEHGLWQALHLTFCPIQVT